MAFIQVFSLMLSHTFLKIHAASCINSLFVLDSHESSLLSQEFGRVLTAPFPVDSVHAFFSLAAWLVAVHFARIMLAASAPSAVSGLICTLAQLLNVGYFRVMLHVQRACGIPDIRPYTALGH